MLQGKYISIPFFLPILLNIDDDSAEKEAITQTTATEGTSPETVVVLTSQRTRDMVTSELNHPKSLLVSGRRASCRVPFCSIPMMLGFF